jgi:hypothetical protein
MIQDLMDEGKVKGSYKDYVVLAGNRLIDWQDSWDMYQSNGESIGVDGVTLMHKARLHKMEMLDKKFIEDKLWHPRWGRRVHPQAKTNPNQAEA